MVAEGRNRKHFLLQKMIIWARSASARNRSRRNDEMMQQKAAQHVGIRAMGKWRASLFRERQGERLQMRAQVFALTKQLGTLQTSQMTAAVLTWKQPVVRQRDADLANLRSRLNATSTSESATKRCAESRIRVMRNT